MKNYSLKKIANLKFIAALMALVILSSSLVGCSSRNKNNADTPKEVVPPATDTKPSQPIPPEDKAPGQSNSQTPDQNQPKPGESTSQVPPEINKLSAEENKIKDELKNEIATEIKSSSSKENPTQATETASGDFADISALSSKKLGWGPGGPVDELNRSSGALSYQEIYGKYDAEFIKENQKKIYLTFDEGYENGYTAQILDVLKEKKVSAVFFITMPYAKSNPELIKRMIDEGHVLGNHSVTHPSFPDTPLSSCKEEITGLHNYIKENYAYEMNLFRFPMGEFNEQDLKLVQDSGYSSVFWSFAYRDWLVDEQPEQATALSNILDHCHPGAIFLLHAVSQTNTEILGQVIDGIVAKGYEVAPFK